MFSRSGYTGKHRAGGQPPEGQPAGEQSEVFEDRGHTNELEALSQPQLEDNLVDILREGLLDSTQNQIGSGNDYLTQGVLLAESGHLGTRPDVARELVGLFGDFAKTDHVDEEYQALFGRLKKGVYGRSDVEPVVLYNGYPLMPDGQIRGVPLGGKHSEEVFEWHGSPIIISPINPNPDLPYHSDTLMRARTVLRMGPDDTWYVQVGEQVLTGESTPMSQTEPRNLGRPELGTNSFISRNAHFSLVDNYPIGVRVINHNEHTGTYYVTSEYPDPTDFRHEQEEQQKEGRISAALRRVRGAGAPDRRASASDRQ